MYPNQIVSDFRYHVLTGFHYSDIFEYNKKRELWNERDNCQILHPEKNA